MSIDYIGSKSEKKNTIVKAILLPVSRSESNNHFDKSIIDKYMNLS